MKKLLGVVFILALLTVFAGCQNTSEVVEPNTDEIDELKQRIEDLEGQLEGKEGMEEKDGVVEDIENGDAKNADDSETPIAKDYSGTNYITLNTPLNEWTTHEEPIIFAGNVSPNTTKIVITATGGDRNCKNGDMCFQYQEDVYKLQNFEYGDTSFAYRAKFEYDNLTLGTNDYEITAYFDDGTTKTTNRTIYFVQGGAEMGKPVIYLYPQETMQIEVNVEPTDGISISDPEIGDGWKVVATPDSRIFNYADRGVYPYLFWEGFAADFVTPEEGFVIAENEVSDFFDEKLAVLGLNQTEIADFKEFWVPRLSGQPYYFITFVPQEDFEKYAPLSVTPEPDSVIRVFFDYQGLDEAVEVKEQSLATPVREGFTVVEWGGRLYR